MWPGSSNQRFDNLLSSVIPVIFSDLKARCKVRNHTQEWVNKKRVTKAMPRDSRIGHLEYSDDVK